jgi:uncharacterized protein (TIGR00297 family)
MDSAASFPNALILGAALAVAFSLLAYLRGWLTWPAALAALLIGTITFASGMTLTFALLFFFLSARLLERSRPSLQDERQLTAQQVGARSLGQVLATGGVPALGAFCLVLTGERAFGQASLAALAFATADTWGTAVGMTSPAPPRLLGFGRQVAAGWSGGITLRGWIASILGACSVGLFAAGWGGLRHFNPLAWVAGLGFAGALVDSILGATVQARYRCSVCSALTENRRHCARRAMRHRGYLSNAGVNLLCSFGVAALAYWIAA